MRFGQSCFRLGMLDVQLMIRLNQPTMEQTEMTRTRSNTETQGAGVNLINPVVT